MRQTRSENAGQSTRTLRRQNRQRLKPNTTDGAVTASHSDRSATGKRKKAPAILSPSQSEGHLYAESQKRTRTDFKDPHQASKKNGGNKMIPAEATRPRSTRSRTSSARLSHRPVDDSRNVTLSEEPPPAMKPTVTSSTDGKPKPPHDPYIEQKRRAREEFRKTGDYKVFQELLAPFRKSGKKRELTDWVFDKEVGRWWRRDKSTELIIWAPT
ncbi:hypothetical protein QBC34DRAFT_180777 [Podospora aff. communis PSN243]|uniref:Uncharacterized protein n=1 Tax=Podospora aff. communis PSN243 TaxID=3040156 RepID=A0AAV9GBC6_9PEZI|nr:hypothetical protein QBC34DRAFT_180777 [Podospora aff. communis PSN243]